MKYFTRKQAILFFFKYVKGFSSSLALLLVTKTHMMHTFHLKPNDFCLLHFTLIFFFYHFLMFQVPLNKLTLQQICGTDDLIYIYLFYLFLTFFCLQLFSSTSALPFSPTRERKHAVNFPRHQHYYKLHCKTSYKMSTSCCNRKILHNNQQSLGVSSQGFTEVFSVARGQIKQKCDCM